MTSCPQPTGDHSVKDSLSKSQTHPPMWCDFLPDESDCNISRYDIHCNTCQGKLQIFNICPLRRFLMFLQVALFFGISMLTATFVNDKNIRDHVT